MIALSSAERYYVYSEPTDGRKGYHSLSGLVRNNLNRDPLGGDVYIFYTRRRNQVRLLRWDRNGYVLLSKHLERGTFSVGASGQISWEQLLMIVEGVDWKKVKVRRRYEVGQK